MEKCSTTK